MGNSFINNLGVSKTGVFDTVKKMGVKLFVFFDGKRVLNNSTERTYKNRDDKK